MAYSQEYFQTCRALEHSVHSLTYSFFKHLKSVDQKVMYTMGSENTPISSVILGKRLNLSEIWNDNHIYF